MHNIYWVGPRQSDIDDSGFEFAGTITIYGDNTNGNISYCQTAHNRINHNIDNASCNLFFQNTLEEICHTVYNCRFLFYNFSYAYQFSDEIQKRTIGLNSLQLLDMLSDKIRCRVTLGKIVNTLPFITLKGHECSFENINHFFPNVNSYVIQKKYSSGGQGTCLIQKETDIKNIINEDEYLISPYFEDAISVNVHIAIVDGKIIIFPPSIQIITNCDGYLLYNGADFICYSYISESIKHKVESNSLKIGEFLMKKGYKGVLGIDYLISNQYLYFMEINPRFQASSQLVNKGLIESKQHSLFEIHMQAFGFLPSKVINSFSIPYSNYTFTENNISLFRLNKILDSDEIASIQMDGYTIGNTMPCEKNSYMCRCIFDCNICSINRRELTVHPNFYVEEISSLLFGKYINHKEYIKFALLNHGLTIDEPAVLLAKSQGVIREAVFDAIDITIFDNISVNVPIKCKFVSFSPFSIKEIDGKYVLFWEQNKICEILISFVPDSLINKTTTSGIPYDAIINLANDRIRINPAPICVFKREKIPCKFCNLPLENATYDLANIIEIIDYCLKYVDFRHFLIGGGTYSVDGGWDIILKIARYIRSKCDKEIYLMTIPPKELSILGSLKDAGITEVAFNLEMFDRELAKQIMPGKGNIPLEQYILAFKHAVSLWGNSGRVRSLLIYGFDQDAVFLKGIEKLCHLGVEPIISIFRPLEKTDLATLNPPKTSDIFTIYQECKKIVQSYNMILGPDCPQCQNNTLSYTQGH